MTRLTGVSALAICAFTTPALADVTPQEVWDDLESYMQSYGYTITATEAMDGNNVNVTDMKMSMALPEDAGEVSLTMDQVSFVDQGDGTVSIGFPATMPIAINAIDGGDEVDLVVDYANEAMTFVVSGDPGNMTYDFAADKITMTLAKLVVEGEEITRDMARAEIVAGPLSGNAHVMLAAGMRSITQTFNYGDIAYDLAFNDPEGKDSGLLNGLVSGVTGSGEYVMPETADYSDPAALFENGFAVSGTINHTGGRMDFAVTERQGTTSGKTSTGSGGLTFAMSGSNLTYKINSTDLKVDVTSPEIPLPISAQIAEQGFTFDVPLQPGEAPQDATFELVLGGFQMADLLWNIFDPAANLPRDPATIRLAMDAKVSPFANIFDPEAMEKIEMGDGAPGELNAVTLRELVVDAVGGKIMGSGAFTFDNSDMESFDGLPRPEGKLDLSVSGANGLLDKLIAMGLMAEQDAMGARMMMGMFTVPGAEPDTATSVIEVNGEGHVLANGQRLK